MLWYKAWLETRWRILVPVAIIAFVLFASHNKGELLALPKSVVSILLFPMLIAGSGINTEAPFRIMKGVNGSTAFILSMPVSRLKLFAVRAIYGMLMTTGFVLALCLLSWTAFPDVRAATALHDGVGYIITAIVCSFAMLGLASFFATFLDQQIRMLACMATLLLPKLLVEFVNAPPSIDIFRAAGGLSPLMTHTMPWVSIFACFAFGTVFFIAGVQIVQRREY